MSTPALPADESEAGYLIAELPLRERPRERLMKYGSESLSDTELLGIVLRSGRRGRSTLLVARDLMRQFGGSLVRLARATPEELQAVKGIGPAKAAELKATFALAARLAEHVEPARPLIGSPEQAADYLRETLRGKEQEELHGLFLDSKNVLIRSEVVTVGLLDRSQAHPREVFHRAIQCSAARIVLVHNHPSGDPTPSQADIRATMKLVRAGEVIGISVVDHVVLGSRSETRPRDFFSFREGNLMPAPDAQ